MPKRSTLEERTIPNWAIDGLGKEIQSGESGV